MGKLQNLSEYHHDRSVRYEGRTSSPPVNDQCEQYETYEKLAMGKSNAIFFYTTNPEIIRTVHLSMDFDVDGHSSDIFIPSQRRQYADSLHWRWASVLDYS